MYCLYHENENLFSLSNHTDTTNKCTNMPRDFIRIYRIIIVAKQSTSIRHKARITDRLISTEITTRILTSTRSSDCQ